MNRILNGEGDKGAVYIAIEPPDPSDSLSRGQIEEHRISHILCLREPSRRIHPGVLYKFAKALDTCDFDLSALIPGCNEFIHCARQAGGNVLVHWYAPSTRPETASTLFGVACDLSMAGVSRSVAVVAAYVMTVTGLDWDIALTAITARRPESCPNEGFRKHLIAYQGARAQFERERLRALYSDNKYKDRENVLEILEDYLQRRELPVLVQRIKDASRAGSESSDL